MKPYSNLVYSPEGLREVFTTGGMPPLVDHPDAVYERTYKAVAKRNEIYYQKYPQDVEGVKQILRFLDSTRITLPTGGVLTPARFLSLGLLFGGEFRQDRYVILHDANWYCF